MAGNWREWLVLGGGVALAAGVVEDRTWAVMPDAGRVLESIVLLVLALLPALALRAWRGWPMATGLAWVSVAALVLFAGPLPVLATALLALGAIAVGRLLAPGAVALPIGLALIAATTGWLLPLPVHVQWTHAAVLAALVAWRRTDVAAACAEFAAGWRTAVASAPTAAWLSMLAVLLVSTGCWVPTMQYDDLAYHLGLPFQLQFTGAYALDPTHQVWALAPWAGDVLHGIAQVVAGREARGAVNALWLVAGAAGVHRLAGLLGASPRARWWTVALFASLPLSLALVAGMQTELPGTAAMLWLACMILEATGDDRDRRLFVGAILVGLLFALKLSHVVAALPLLAWAAWRHRHAIRPARLAIAAALVALVGGASYGYAWFIAGNPVLPLFNATFGSSYFAARNFVDERWQHGLDATLPWDITFDTGHYYEGFDGALGFVLVAALGAWVVALVQPRTRALAIAASGGMLLSVLPLQYARYLYPSLVLVLPALVAALDASVPRRRAAWLVAILCVAQLAMHGNAYWMFRTGAVKATVLALGDDAPVLAKFAPERLLLAQLRETAPTSGRVLVLGTQPEAFAELGVRGRTVSWYAPALEQAAKRANTDPSGRQWAVLLQRQGVTDVVLREASLDPAQRAGLSRLGAVRIASEDVAEWWHVPGRAP